MGRSNHRSTRRGGLSRNVSSRTEPGQPIICIPSSSGYWQMMTRRCWDRIIQVRWSQFGNTLRRRASRRRSPRVLLIHAAILASVFTALAATDPLVELKNASAAIDAGRYPAAIAVLRPLEKKLPKLADYVAWFLATAQFQSQDYAD